MRLLACLIIGIAFSTANLLAEDEEASREFARSLIVGACENNLLIRKMDVVINEDYMCTPTAPEDASLLKSVNEVKRMRIVMDRDAERCLRVGNFRQEVEGAKTRNSEFSIQMRSIDRYHDGAASSTQFQSNLEQPITKRSQPMQFSRLFRSCSNRTLRNGQPAWFRR